MGTVLIFAVLPTSLKIDWLEPASSFISPLYFILLTWKFGATVGKKLLGIKVVRSDGRSLGFWKVFLRETVGKWISAIPFELGYFWVIWDKKKEAWHDKISGTRVTSNVQNDGKESPGVYVAIGIGIFLPILGVLAAIVITAINPAGQLSKARDVKRKNDLQTVQTSLISYYADNESYPKNLDVLVPNYLPAVPVDPKTSTNYNYSLTKSGFTLCANVENISKVDGTSTGEVCVSNQ